MKPFLFLLLATLMMACSTVPLTGRKQLTIIPDSEMLALGEENYETVLDSAQLSNNTADINDIREVGNNIAKAVEKYLKEAGHSDLVDGYDWEFNLIESPQVNAWCMPGGKIAFYTGILPVCEDDNGIAVVMSHEIAHAIAKHSSERMSQEMAIQMGGVALSEALITKSSQTNDIAMMAFGLGSQLGVVLPYSRSHESEADELGLYFMAMAGYDPREAPKFWERMLDTSQSGVPEFLSTHPDPKKRIKSLNQNLPKALEYYN